MGSYCQYCGNRCFLLRVTRDGHTWCLATCPRGMAHDLGSVGETHETAVNPYTDPEGAARRAAAPEPLTPDEFCGYDSCRHHVNAHTYAVGAEVECVACPGQVCKRDVYVLQADLGGRWTDVAQSTNRGWLATVEVTVRDLNPGLPVRVVEPQAATR